MWSVFRGRAQTNVFEAAMFEQKKILTDDMRCSLNETFQIIYYRFKEKCNGEAALCWSHFIFS